MASIFRRAREVLWSPVGRDPEELLLVQEGGETCVYVVTGRVGVALWTRLDGSRSVDDLARDLSDHTGISREQALVLITPFIDQLQEHHLLDSLHDSSEVEVEPVDPAPWPDQPIPSTLVPFSPESLAAPELVAVGSYLGGLDNAGSGPQPCQVGPGGWNNYGGAGPCRAGQHGFGNVGNGPPCS